MLIPLSLYPFPLFIAVRYLSALCNTLLYFGSVSGYILAEIPFSLYSFVIFCRFWPDRLFPLYSDPLLHCMIEFHR